MECLPPDVVTDSRLQAVLKTSLVEEGPATAAAPWAAAEAEYRMLLSMSPRAIMQDHVAAWAELHASRIELEGPAGATDDVAITIAAAVNASMFNLLQVCLIVL